MSELLPRLKDETADCHVALESALDLGRPSMSRDEYIALLQAFRRFIGPWETALRAVLPARLQDFAKAREKAALLDADLDALGCGLPGSERTSDADTLELPPMTTLAQALGAMYVMEGSTLGGRFIGPAMAKRFALSERRGYAYFDPYGAHTGQMWNAFKALVTSELDVTQHDEAVASARATFGLLQDVLPHAPKRQALAADAAGTS